MDTATLLYISPLIISATVLVGLLAISWRNRTDAASPWFAVTILGFLMWCVGYIFEFASPTLQGKIWWADLQFVGIALVPVAWLEVVRRYSGRRPLPWPAAVAEGAFVVVSLVVVYLDPGGAFRGSPSLDTSASPSVLVPDYGWYWSAVFMPVVYMLLTVAVVLLARRLWQERQSLYRRQYVLLIVATVLPLAAGTAYVLGLTPVRGLNPAPAVVSISGAIMAYALFRYRLFDIKPLARDAVVDGLPDGVIVLDGGDRIVDFNPAAAQLFPGLRGAALGRPVSEVLAFHPGLLESIGQVSARTAEPDTVVAELTMALPGDGLAGGELPESRHFALALSPVRERSGRVLGHSVLLHDVTRSVELLHQVERLATTDHLTELLTRRAFLEVGEREVTRARRHGFPIWLLLLDLDHFSLVNDLYGADAGDDVLRAVSSLLRRLLRTFDLVGRIAGDEFAILLPHLSAEEAEQTAERLRQAVEGLAVWEGDRLVAVTASLGLAGLEEVEAVFLADIMAPAEQALRRAQDEGRNRVCRGVLR